MKKVRTILLMVMLLGLSVQIQAAIYTDQTTFTAALAGLPTSDNFSYALGDISNGQTRGDFTYTFNSPTQPGIASNGIGGNALGVFVGGDAVTLTYNGVNQLTAFGANFSFAPNFEALPSNLYQLLILDGNGVGTSVGNKYNVPFDPNTGGAFFLGFIGDPFTMVSLQSPIVTDADGNPYLTPAYQVDNLIYESAAPVPEPGTLILLIVGGAALIPIIRKRARMPL